MPGTSAPLATHHPKKGGPEPPVPASTPNDEVGLDRPDITMDTTTLPERIPAGNDINWANSAASAEVVKLADRCALRPMSTGVCPRR